MPTTVALGIMAAGITGGIVIGNKQWRAEISPAMAGRRGGVSQ
jgi:hypothetical protein